MNSLTPDLHGSCKDFQSSILDETCETSSLGSVDLTGIPGVGHTDACEQGAGNNQFGRTIRHKGHAGDLVLQTTPGCVLLCDQDQ